MSVSVHVITPELATLGALHVAVKPFGSPDAMLIFSLLAATPPTGVAVTVTEVVDNDCTEIAVGETASVTPGACRTFKFTLWLVVRLSPAAVTVIVGELTEAEDEAVSVRVEVLVADPDEGVSGLALQLAVTPEGRPVTDRVMLPLNDPPVVAVTPAVA